MNGLYLIKCSYVQRPCTDVDFAQLKIKISISLKRILLINNKKIFCFCICLKVIPMKMERYEKYVERSRIYSKILIDVFVSIK